MSHRYFEDKDQAAFYNRSRPEPSPEIISEILGYLKKNLEPNGDGKWELAVDVGCGSGQCTKKLHSHFHNVYGFDISEAQINEANKTNSLANVEYKVSPSEDLPISDSCVDLMTACQCFHWFNFNEFFSEAARVLKPNGVLAVIGYPIPTVHLFDSTAINPQFDSNILFNIYRYSAMKPYFEMDRLNYLDNGYNDIKFPFNDVVRSRHISEKESTAMDCIEYVESWSGFRSCYEKDITTATNVLHDLKTTFMTVFNEFDLTKINVTMKTNNILIVCRK